MYLSLFQLIVCVFWSCLVFTMVMLLVRHVPRQSVSFCSARGFRFSAYVELLILPLSKNQAFLVFICCTFSFSAA